jgi:uncharacterized repeat protein (TIGR03803 family)
MTRLMAWKIAGAVLLLCGATAIGAQAQTFDTLVTFEGMNGASPVEMSLAQGTDGNLYGTTETGGTHANVALCGGGCGTVFRVTTSGTLTTLYNFCVARLTCADGAIPQAGLIQAADGNFYGTTLFGGAAEAGTIFRITPEGGLTNLHTFKGADGAMPEGKLVQAVDGNLYGTTSSGGSNGGGTIFKVTNSGALLTVYNFCSLANCADGNGPTGLIQATDGNFYGTTYQGGVYENYGTVFRFTPSGKLITLHSFDPAEAGGSEAPLVQASDGKLYGTTGGIGFIFRITLAGEFATIYKFCSQNGCPGGYGSRGLMQATDGNLYGTDPAGGIWDCGDGCGTVFNFSPPGVFAILHSFDGVDGASPFGSLLQDTNGVFYGTTTYGASGFGTLFSLSMGLGPFVAFVQPAGAVGGTAEILAQGLTGTSSVLLNETPATFTVVSDTYIKARVPAGATTGYVTVTTPSGVLTSNVPFQVIP